MKKKDYDRPTAELLVLDMQRGVLDASVDEVGGDQLPTLGKDDDTLGWN